MAKKKQPPQHGGSRENAGRKQAHPEGKRSGVPAVGGPVADHQPHGGRRSPCGEVPEGPVRHHRRSGLGTSGLGEAYV